jgi:hypothetical protein
VERRTAKVDTHPVQHIDCRDEEEMISSHLIDAQMQTCAQSK